MNPEEVKTPVHQQKPTLPSAMYFPQSFSIFTWKFLRIVIQNRSFMNTSISSGIKTRELLNNDIYGHRVEWISWDSDFRQRDLQIGDIITGVNNKQYTREHRDGEFFHAIGNYHEHIYWEKQNAKDNDEITLHINREQQVLQIKGQLREEKFYHNKDNRRTLGDNGPDRMKNDGFSGPWSGWYERFVKTNSQYLVDKWWERTSFNNRIALKDHLEEKARVDYFIENHPGTFANMLKADWERVHDVLKGRPYEITPKDLEYRGIGEKRQQLVKDAAAKGKKQFLETISEVAMPAFPSIDPVNDDRTTVAGKIIQLPPITFRDFINDLGKSYAVIGSRYDGYYIIHLNSPEMDLFFDTMFRYQSQITPDIVEKYEFFGEILDDPAMITYKDRPITGLMVKVVAVTLGNEDMFVDLRNSDANGETMYSGEAELGKLDTVTPDANAGPKEIIAAMISSIKLSNRKQWQSLFGNWRVFHGFDGSPTIDMAYELPDNRYQRMWEHSRRLILDEVYDARVVKIFPVKILVEADEENGFPEIAQVKVIIDHIGKFNEEYISFSNLKVRRKWILQRIDKGPWKIIDPQHL